MYLSFFFFIFHFEYNEKKKKITEQMDKLFKREYIFFFSQVFIINNFYFNDCKRLKILNILYTSVNLFIT